MQQLTELDAAFLALDSPVAYGHVGSVSILDPPAGGEALTLERLTGLIESRLQSGADGQGLNLTVLGSNGKPNFGALADRDLVPDVDLIIDALKNEVAALSDAVRAG